MLTYSIVIRTLGTGGDKYREELRSITYQTVQPDRVVVYIAEGYPLPGFTVGREEYIPVKKGMMAQRLLPYDEITSDCMLMLDDDVRLASDSAERMLKAMEEHQADCVAADVFKNQDMNFTSKLYAAVTNLVFPHSSRIWAFKVHRNGSFSYNNRPVKSFYRSQSAAGPASMWRKSVYRRLHLEDELWLDEFPFAYGEDLLAFYKLHRNGFRLGILYDSGVEHMDGGSSSRVFRQSPQRMYVRTKASFIIWWRTCFCPGDTSLAGRIFTLCCFLLKVVWLWLVVCGVAVVMRRPLLPVLYVRGLADGWNFVHSPRYRSLGRYVVR